MQTTTANALVKVTHLEEQNMRLQTELADMRSQLVETRGQKVGGLFGNYIIRMSAILVDRRFLVYINCMSVIFVAHLGKGNVFAALSG